MCRPAYSPVQGARLARQIGDLWRRALQVAVISVVTLFTTNSLAQPGKADVVMLGDSITWGGKWESRFPSLHIVNRAVPGYKTSDVLRELDAAIAIRPKRFILMVGINDLLSLTPVDQVYDGVTTILRRLQATGIPVILFATLECSRRTCVQAVDNVRDLNRMLGAYAREAKIPFIDLNGSLADPVTGLMPRYTWDGLHLSEPAYAIWAEALAPYLK